MLPELERFLAENVKGVKVDAQAIQAHVLHPDFAGASSPRVRPPGIEWCVLDVGKFEVALDNALKNVVAGYVAQLRQSGQIVFTKQWQYAQRPSDGGEVWTPDVQLHVASVSKLMTAMAMTVLLRDNGISPDAQIIDYLPDYWAKGPNIEYIVFRNLFNHTSGLSGYYLVDLGVLQSAIAAGISLDLKAPLHLGTYYYQNLNYGLCRVLLAVINGNIARSAYYPPIELPLGLQRDINGAIWDQATIKGYESYVQAKVFQAAGVTGATLDHLPACGLAYKDANDMGPGWNSGPPQSACGCDGWHLSVNELLDVMGEFRRGGGILTPADAQVMLDNGFGVDPLVGNSALPTAYPTCAGNVYCKPGDWHDGNNRDEQALAYFLPQDMELAVFVNSMVAEQLGSTNNFRSIVTQAYVNSVPQPTLHL